MYVSIFIQRPEDNVSGYSWVHSTPTFSLLCLFVCLLAFETRFLLGLK